jgi:thiol-disulfide isomerase/thioredoxin
MVLTALALLTGCGSPSEGPSARTAGDGVPSQLEFTAATLDGKQFDGRTLAGKPAVLWFWTPWCVICRHEAGFIADLAAKHGDDVTFVGVAAQDEVSAMREFAGRYGIDAFTNLNDADGAVWARFGVPAQPAFAFISAGGEVERVNGTVTEQEFDRWLATRARS